MTRKKIHGFHPYEQGIDLRQLQRLLEQKSVTYPQGWTESPVKNPRRAIEVDFAIGSTKTHYTFRENGYEYTIQDAQGQPIRKPKAARHFAIKNALFWLQHAGKRGRENDETEAEASGKVQTMQRRIRGLEKWVRELSRQKLELQDVLRSQDVEERSDTI